jgi:hypothetical protein
LPSRRRTRELKEPEPHGGMGGLGAETGLEMATTADRSGGGGGGGGGGAGGGGGGGGGE